MADLELNIELPASERGISAADQSRFDRLKAKLNRPDLPKDKREQAMRELAALSGRKAEEADQAWRSEVRQETSAIARGRGEVVAEEKSGALRVLDRDPILSLFRAGHLTVDQFDVALTYRGLYEDRTADAATANYTDAAGGGHDNARFVWNRLERAKAGGTIDRAEVEIAKKCPDDPAPLQVFTGIARDNRSVTSFGKGRAFERNVAAFARALDIAADQLTTAQRARLGVP